MALLSSVSWLVIMHATSGDTSSTASSSNNGAARANTVAVLITMLPLVSVVMLFQVVWTVRGLIKWHRYFALRETPVGSVLSRSQRGWTMFVQWFVLGFAYCLLLILLDIAVLYLSWRDAGPIQGGNAGSITSVWTVIADAPFTVFLLSLATVVIGSALFALVFSRRSVRLAYVASDADASEKLPGLSLFALPHRGLKWVLAASLAVPIIALQGLDVAVAQWMIGPTSLPADFNQFDTVQELLWQVIGTEALFSHAPLIITGVGLTLLEIFYPMLVFATAVSLYYREHVRKRLFAQLPNKSV